MSKKYKEKELYSAKTINDLAKFIEQRDVTIIELNGNFYRIEKLKEGYEPRTNFKTN
jgi:hypothetical protein